MYIVYDIMFAKELIITAIGTITATSTIADRFTGEEFWFINSKWKPVPVPFLFERLSCRSNISFHAIVWGYSSFVYNVFSVTFAG